MCHGKWDVKLSDPPWHAFFKINMLFQLDKWQLRIAGVLPFGSFQSRAVEYIRTCVVRKILTYCEDFSFVIVQGVLKEFELLWWSQVHINIMLHKLWIHCKQKWSGFVALAQTLWTTKSIESTIKNLCELEVFEPPRQQNLWNIKHFIAYFLSRCAFNVINVRISVRF